MDLSKNTIFFKSPTLVLVTILQDFKLQLNYELLDPVVNCNYNSLLWMQFYNYKTTVIKYNSIKMQLKLFQPLWRRIIAGSWRLVCFLDEKECWRVVNVDGKMFKERYED